MPGIIDKIPTMNDQDLLNLFQNAVRALAEEKRVEEAKLVLAAIESEWEKRLNQAQVGNHLASRPTVGMLATLGYRVGANGESTPVRRKILSRVLEGQLPMVGSPAYTYEWGTPNSAQRYEKLVHFFESQINNPANHNKPNMEKAMIEWCEDLEWVRKTYEHRMLPSFAIDAVS